MKENQLNATMSKSLSEFRDKNVLYHFSIKNKYFFKIISPLSEDNNNASIQRSSLVDKNIQIVLSTKGHLIVNMII